MIDSHAHLDTPAFDSDRDAVLQRAFDAGVHKIVLIGLGIDGTKRAIELAKQYPERLFVTAGVHPHDAESFTDMTIDELRDLTAHPQVVGVGECGLDYYRNYAPHDVQKVAFKAQLELAKELKLPFVLHCRDKDSDQREDEDAYRDCERIIGEVFEKRYSEHDRGHQRIGIAHCFSGDLRDARAFIKLGMYISFPGSLTFKKAEPLREVAREVNADHCLVETDAPYIAPMPHRGKRNESAYVMLTAAKLAEVKGLSLQDIDRITTRNCDALFGPAFAGDIDAALHKRTVVYPIRDALYINLTNRCNCRCVFCPRESFPVARGHWLGMREAEEPSVDEVKRAIVEAGGVRSESGGAGVGDGEYREVVFCGFGEPTIRLPELVAIGKWLRAQGCRVRLNTNGHGNVIHGRDITPDLEGALDCVSISLNAQDGALYHKLMRPEHDGDSYAAMKAFAIACKPHVPEVVMTALEGFPGVDMEACAAIAKDELGVTFRWREYEQIG